MNKPTSRQLWLLGPTRVDHYRGVQEAPVKGEMGQVPRFRSRSTVALLGYLVAERRPVAREHLAALFWPDEPPVKGRANLSRELHNLTQILPGCWQTDRKSVAFIAASDTTVDIYQLEQLEQDEKWLACAELVCGDFLEGLYLPKNGEFENWLLVERDRWRMRSEAVLRKVIEGYIIRGRYSDGLQYARRLLQVAPWDEDVHRQVMRLLAWTGQRGEALRQFDICQQLLSEQLDVEPSKKTTRLFQQIESGQLKLPAQLPAFLTDERSRRVFQPQLFVGREAEMRRLHTFLGTTLTGQSQILFITGGPGRGKTALLNAFSRLAHEQHPDLLVVTGKCTAYSGVGDPYLPFRDILAMLTGDVEGRWDVGAISRDHAQRLWAAFPLVVHTLLKHGRQLLDIFIPRATLLTRSIAAGQEQAQWFPQLKEFVNHDRSSIQELDKISLFQQITEVFRVISQKQPLLLIIDDIQWADTASINLLFHLGRRLIDVEGNVMIACAYRPEELTTGRAGSRHPLLKVLNEFKRSFGDIWIDLGLSDPETERRFVDEYLDTEVNLYSESFRSALFDRTRGYPLFTIDLLSAMKDRGDLVQDRDGRWTEGQVLDWHLLPSRVEAVIEDRLDRLDPELQEILSIASVEGEQFTADVVAAVKKVPEWRILSRLSQDLERQHRLVREQEEIYTGLRRLSRYRFSHILYQDFLYQRLSHGERRLLHSQVAMAMEKLYHGQLDEIALQLAHHFHRAGEEEDAFYYYTRAGHRAAGLYESGQAISHYTSAIKLAENFEPDTASLIELHHQRGLAYGIVGEFKSARADFEMALDLAQLDGEQEAEWRAMLELGRLWASRDYEEARECFKSSLELAQQLDQPALEAMSLNWMGNWCANNADFERATSYHQQALKIFEELGDRQELANTLDLLGLANLLGGDLNQAILFYDRAISLGRQLDDRVRLASGLIGRATTTSGLIWLASVATPPTTSPDADLQEALQISRKIGASSEEIWAFWSSGLLNILRANFGKALEQMQAGLHLALEIGHREWVAGTHCGLGSIYAELFAANQALQHLEQALNLARKVRSPTWIHLVSAAMSGVFLQRNDLASAAACLEVAISPDTPMITLGNRHCWLRQAELAMLQDDPVTTLDIIDRLITAAPGMATGRVIPYLWKVKADALISLSDKETPHDRDATLVAALNLLQEAIRNAQINGEQFLLWRLYGSLGHLHLTQEQPHDADRALSVACAFIEALAKTIPDEWLRDNFRQHALLALPART